LETGCTVYTVKVGHIQCRHVSTFLLT